MRILIELPSWLGDTVMASAAIENIVNHFSGEEIILIGSFLSTEVLKNHPKVFKTIVLSKNYLSLVKNSRELGKFDSFFSFRSSFRSKVLKYLVSSKNKYQFNKSRYKNLHQVEKYSQFVNTSLNTNFSQGNLIIYSDITEETKVNIQKPTLGINPGASYGNAKRWYPDEFSKVAIKLADKYEIIIFGGKEEIDIARDIEENLIKNDVLNYKNLAGKTSLNELIEYISNLDLFITGDSGPMHIAGCFQVPTISIFGPTRHDETSQWMNDKSVIVKKTLECQPCMMRSCPLNHHNCMRLIKSTDILNAVESLNLVIKGTIN
jgi:heptosyltransferase II